MNKQFRDYLNKMEAKIQANCLLPLPISFYMRIPTNEELCRLRAAGREALQKAYEYEDKALRGNPSH